MHTQNSQANAPEARANAPKQTECNTPRAEYVKAESPKNNIQAPDSPKSNN